MSSQRVAEMLEQLKSEYDQILQDSTVYKAQRDDYERKREYLTALHIDFVHHQTFAQDAAKWRCCASLSIGRIPISTRHSSIHPIPTHT
jgi:hypothetical protein